MLAGSGLVSASENTQATAILNHRWAEPIDKSIIQNGYKLNDLIYRSGQPNHESFKKLYGIGIRKTLNLRLFHNDYGEIAGLPIEEIHVPMFLLNIKKAELIQTAKILAETKEPILVHCKDGSNRTGLVIAAYRILVEGWSANEAEEEMKKGGYGYLYIWGDFSSLLHFLDTPETRKMFRQ